MKNIFTALVLAVIIYEVKSQILCESSNGESEDDCRFRVTNVDTTHCCYVPEDDEVTCWELTDDEYENIKRFKHFSKQLYDYSDLTIKCSNQALTISLLCLISLLFLL